jgi:hypothetical protein
MKAYIPQDNETTEDIAVSVFKEDAKLGPHFEFSLEGHAVKFFPTKAEALVLGCFLAELTTVKP